MPPPPYDRLSAQPQAAALLALLRAGEQSAGAAFDRIAHRLSPGQMVLAAPDLAQLVADERRHDAVLAAHAEVLPVTAVGDAATRRFFRRLESRETCVHLARVATLDACVCQVLSRVLAAPVQEFLNPSLIEALWGIRRDEGRHVRVTRRLALEFDIETARFRQIGFEVRAEFASLLLSRAPAFEALGVDSTALIARVRRDG